MKYYSKNIVLVFALLFLVWGIFWLWTLDQRCRILNPAPVSSDGAAGESKAGPEVIRFRSPHVRPYHTVSFWLLVSLELIGGVLYVISGYLLLRRIFFARRAVLGALWCDAVFKIGLAAYLFKFAIPLERLIQNGRNIVTAYYLPGGGWVSSASRLVSGLSMYYPKISVYLLVYLAYISLALFYFTRPEVRAVLEQKRPRAPRAMKENA